MADEKRGKCAHPPCSCTVESGKYCSAQCEAMEKTPSLECQCLHTGCRARPH